MQMRKLLIGGVLMGIGYGIYRIVNNAGKLQFGQAKLTSTKYEPLTTLIFYISLPVTNPTDTNFPFKGITGGAFYGATELAKIQLNTAETIVLRKGKTVSVPIKIVVDGLKLSSDVFQLIKSGNWLNKAVIKGTVKSDLSFPFESKIF